MASLAQVRMALLEIEKFTQHQSTALHRISGAVRNPDLMEFGESIVILREALEELTTIAGATEFRIRMYERLAAMGLDNL